jgi:hypothetical protein
MAKPPKYERRIAELQCSECAYQFEGRVWHVAIQPLNKSEPLGWVVHSYNGVRCPSCGSELIGPKR